MAVITTTHHCTPLVYSNHVFVGRDHFLSRLGNSHCKPQTTASLVK